MQVRADQLAAQLRKGLRPVTTVWGDEPLLVQEACDAVRAAARAAGCSERQLHTVAGAHFDWSGLLGAAMARSLFADRQMIEIRMASGKPGKDGGDALQRFCKVVSDDTPTLVVLPRLDRTQQSSAWFGALDGAGITVRVDPVERGALPAWIAQRLARQGQRVEEGEAGRQALAAFADRTEGNLLATHQEIEKLALLHPEGELGLAAIEAAVSNVARYDAFRLGEALLGGQLERGLRMLDGLEAEGEAPVKVHWTLAEDIRALHRVRVALGAGRPLPVALREGRVWGAKEKLFERVVPRFDAAATARLVEAAQVCDGLVKGLRHPDWPAEPWAALRRLALMMVEPGLAASGGVRHAARVALGA